jgi:hypothetical protein
MWESVVLVCTFILFLVDALTLWMMADGIHPLVTSWGLK